MKSLKFTNLRTRGNEPPFDPVIIPRTVESGFHSLVAHELGWSGRVTDISPTRIVVETQVMSCLDTTIIEGSEEDMELLVEACVMYLEVLKSASSDYNDALNSKVMAITKGKPLLIAMGAGLIMGGPRCHLALCSMLRDYTYVNPIMQMKLDDLCAVVMMVRRDGATIKEAMELAASVPAYDATGKITGLTLTKENAQ